MGRVRTLLVAASLTTAAAALGIVPAVGAAGGVSTSHAARTAAATGTAATETTPACGTVPAGYAACLVRVRHRAGSQQSTSPTGYSPTTIKTAYGFAKTSDDTGTGKTVALVDAYNDPTIASNLSTFSTKYGLPACTTANGCFTQVNQTGGTTKYPADTSGWDVEISLDVEWAHAIAPKAHILLVEASSNSYTSLFTAVRYAAEHATYVSMSWGGGESSTETSFNSAFTSRTSKVSFFAAAGDSASEVIYPSASPDVISVGGTTLTVSSTGTWEAESAWSTGGGGCSKYETAAAAQADFATYGDASCNGKRATPDVALDANPDTGVSIYDSVRTPEFGSGWEKVGGTSVATPIWAAHSAAAGDRVNATFVYGSNINFYDITTGSNGHKCVTGYNLCDGLGSWNTVKGTKNGVTAGSLSITPASTSLVAGTDVQLSVNLSKSQTTAVRVTLSTTSSGGGFSATSSSSSSNFTKTLTLTVPAGTKSATFYYYDTVAGSPTLTASASGWSSGSRSVTVTAGTLATITVSPATVSLGEKATQTFTATGADTYGNAVSIDPTWAQTGTFGSVVSTASPTTVFTAGTTAGTDTVTATEDGISGHATVTVTSTPTLTVSVSAGSVTERGRTYEVPLTVKASGTSGGVKGAKVTLDVYSETCTGSLAASGSGTTGSSGSASFTFSTSSTGTYCAKATATDSGYDEGSGTTSFSITSSTRGVRPSSGK